MEDKIITITTCPYSRAQLIKGKLESEGIECFLSNINLIQAGIASGVDVKINESDTEAAFHIINEIFGQSGYGKDETVKKLKNIRRILVPVDFSEYSLSACNFAVSLAQKLKAEIRLLYAYYNPIVGTEPYLEGQSFDLFMEQVLSNIEYDARRHMHELKEKLRNQVEKANLKNLKIKYSLDKGAPENVILHYINKYKPGVVVMGTRGAGEGSGGILGGVTKKVIDRANVPILTIPEKSIFSGMKLMKRVLYATNFDDSDFVSLRKLMTLIRPFNMEIYCVHISFETSSRLEEAKMNTLKNHLKNEYEDYNVKCDIITYENIFQGLQQYIDIREIDLIALTTHKRGIFERLFNPSIAREMLFHTHLPLLVFHS